MLSSFARPRRALSLAAAAAATLSLAGAAQAAAAVEVLPGDVVVQLESVPPANPWTISTRNAGAPLFVSGPATAPAGAGSLQLSTPTGADKVYAFNYGHVGTKLADVAAVGYSTYRSTGAAQQVAALNLQVDANGAAPGGFTTLVFEPVYNTGQGLVESGKWQSWDAHAAGTAVWWSSNPIPAAPNRDTFVSLDTIRAANPDAVVVGGVGPNQGSGNPALVSSVDAFTFGATTYDFEPALTPASKADCKDGGFAAFNSPRFSNQGQCVSFIAAAKG